MGSRKNHILLLAVISGLGVTVWSDPSFSQETVNALVGIGILGVIGYYYNKGLSFNPSHWASVVSKNLHSLGHRAIMSNNGRMVIRARNRNRNRK